MSPKVSHAQSAWVFCGVLIFSSGCDDPSALRGPDAGTAIAEDAGNLRDAGFVDAGAVDAGDVDAGAVDAGEPDAGPPACIYPDDEMWAPFPCEDDQDTCDAVGDSYDNTRDGLLYLAHKDVLGTWSETSDDGQAFFVYVRFASRPYRYSAIEVTGTRIRLIFYDASAAIADFAGSWLVGLADLQFSGGIAYPPTYFFSDPRPATTICNDVAFSTVEPVVRFTLPRSFVSRLEERVEYSVDIDGVEGHDFATNGENDLESARVRSRGGRPDMDHDSFVSVCDLTCPSAD